jgi:hypothetical protein
MLNNNIALRLLPDLLNILQINNLVIIDKPLIGNNIAEWELLPDTETENGIYHNIRLNYYLIDSIDKLRDDLAHELAHAWLYENIKDLPIEHGVEFCFLGIKLLYEHKINIFCNSCLSSDIVKATELYFNAINEQ